MKRNSLFMHFRPQALQATFGMSINDDVTVKGCHRTLSYATDMTTIFRYSKFPSFFSNTACHQVLLELLSWRQYIWYVGSWSSNELLWLDRVIRYPFIDDVLGSGASDLGSRYSQGIKNSYWVVVSIGFIELGRHWFRKWLGACSAPSHCAN